MTAPQIFQGGRHCCGATADAHGAIGAECANWTCTAPDDDESDVYY